MLRSSIALVPAQRRDAHPSVTTAPIKVQTAAVTSAQAAALAVPTPRSEDAPRATSCTASRSWYLPSFADLVFLGCLLVALAGGARMISADGDPSRHLAVGQLILSTGAIPHQDVFSHTMAGQPFVPYEWLAEVASAAAFWLAGWAGTVLLHGAVIGASFALVYSQTRSRGVPVLLAVLAAGAAIMASTLHWLARPHVFTFLGTAVFAFVLDGWYRGRLGRRWLWTLPPAMALWANLHGGFLIGLILLGAYAAADALRWLASGSQAARSRFWALAVVSTAVLAATLLNPAGPALLEHVTGYLSKGLLVDRTIEYRSPDFHEANARAFMVLILLSLSALAWSTRRVALHEGLLLAGFTYFALFSARNIPLYAIVGAPLLASQAQRLAVESPLRPDLSARLASVAGWLAQRSAVYARMEERTTTGVWPALVLAALIAVAAVQRAQGVVPLDVQPSPALQPVAAVKYLREYPVTGNGFNELIWGGYLLHELWPAQRVFIDGQTDFYGEALSQEYLDVVELHQNWRDVLAAHDVRWILYETNSPLVRQLEDSGEWRVLHGDDLATLLARAER